jgi:hypothetical protein
VRLSIGKSIIVVGFYVIMLVLFFNYCSEPLDTDTNVDALGIFLPKFNIYQIYVMDVISASIFSMMFNALCARIELGVEWCDSSFFDNRWTFIYICLFCSGVVLFFLMFFVPNPIISWRIYQVINFLLIAFLDMDKVEAICNYFDSKSF